ncbi:interferon-induced, double-stranded RNA-activated protein kinase [Gouania willdenowi]|uniref:non-specific serine/threonine protein kinase n=1 Tax=Gouania willdenowi TaxID=441366 RepID=A0A8C5EWF9_GOUWI|nr:interferon-induced, double-stranded RNA-activated protein kinase-like [Gouania willdenowi]
METKNYVAKLNEFAQKRGFAVKYEDVAAVWPAITFSIRAVVNGTVFPDGVGLNKKEAKQNAAKNAYMGLQEESSHEVVEEVKDVSTAEVQPINTTNFVSWLNEHGQKHKLRIKHVETTKIVSLIATQCCRFIVGDVEYPEAHGKTRKEAKEAAAKMAYNEICGSKTTESGDHLCSPTSRQKKEDVGQKTSEICNLKMETCSVNEPNFTALLHNYIQKKRYSHTYIEVKRSGPAHNYWFVYKLQINNIEYPEGEGKTVKEAKQNAAKLALSALQEKSAVNSGLSAEDSSPKQSPPTSSHLPRDSGCAKSSPSAPTTDSVVFTNSSIQPKHQVQSPDVKPKIRIAANFPKFPINNNKVVETVKEQNQKPPVQSKTSRFTTDYDSIERLGKGGFGRVFKAKQKLLNRYFAIKIVQCKEKALREVEALSDLFHVNIVRYYTCWIEDTEYESEISTDSVSSSQSSTDSSLKYLYIQMELCNTRTLKVWIDEKNVQNVKKSLQDSKRREESMKIALQVVSGVEYIHGNMLIHRDLKPANILFDLHENVKLGDFGLVTVDNDDKENLVERTAYKGTRSYMAPEQRGRATYDRKVDIFALGLIHFELLWNLSTGHERAKLWEDARSQNFPVKFCNHFYQESQIIKSMLCLKPEERPEASKLKKDLEECQRTLAIPTDASCKNKTY